MIRAGPLTQDEALEAARRYADERGGTWRGALHVQRVRHAGAPAVQVDTPVGFLGVNARIVVGAEDGRVLDGAFNPR